MLAGCSQESSFERWLGGPRRRFFLARTLLSGRQESAPLHAASTGRSLKLRFKALDTSSKAWKQHFGAFGMVTRLRLRS